MKVVYLDQNKWIELARAHHGKSSDASLRRVLAFIRSSGADGSHVFPLSAIHYMETARISDPRRRARLGEVMWELSRGYTLASYRLVLARELEDALARRFPEVVPRPQELVSSGVAHAFGAEFRKYALPEPYRSLLDPRAPDAIEEVIRLAIEKSVLTGMGPGGITMPAFKVTMQNQQFMTHLTTLYPQVSQLPRDKWEDALYAISLSDILAPLNEVFRHHKVAASDFERLGKDGIEQFIEDLPSRRIDLHLHRQILRNPRLRPKLSDLEDWGGLGPAAAHCDVIVCEKHFANLLRRDDFIPRAAVLTDVRALPGVC